MRSAALLLCLAALARAEDVKLAAEDGLPAADLVRRIHEASGGTLVYPPADLRERRVRGSYALEVPQDRLQAAAELLLGSCGLELRQLGPLSYIVPGNALETRFHLAGKETEIRFNRSPAGWQSALDARDSLDAESVSRLLDDARGGTVEALDVLAVAGPRDGRTVDAIAGLLRTGGLRERAAATLARIGFAAKPAIPALKAAAEGLPEGEAAPLVRAIAEIETARHPDLLFPAKAATTAPERFVVRFETTKGDFELEVHRDWAPRGADRFFSLVRVGYYDGCRFFRVLPGFVAQFGKSGDPDVNKAWYPANIEDDVPVESNKRGYATFAAGNEPNSRGTQVFVNLADNTHLDKAGFAPFGRVTKGMEVLDRLYGGYGEAPDQGLIHFRGEEYLAEKFPKLDWIRRATVVE